LNVSFYLPELESSDFGSGSSEGSIEPLGNRLENKNIGYPFPWRAVAGVVELELRSLHKKHYFLPTDSGEEP